MAQQPIFSDSQRPFGGPNGGLSGEFGDQWDEAVAKINAMFAELYDAIAITPGSGLELVGGTLSIAPSGVTNAMLVNPQLVLGSTALTLGGTYGLINGGLTFGGTVNFSGSLEIGGTALTLPVSVPNGGTGAGSFTGNAVLYGSGTSALGATAVNSGATNKFLTQVNGFAPVWNTIANSDLPTPTTGALGGVKAINAVAHEWIASIDTTGTPQLSQPAFTDLSGNISTGQMNSGTGASSSTFWRGDGTWAAISGAGSANPSATIGLSAVNGTALTFMTSDSAPPLSQAIAPTWTGFHKFNSGAQIDDASSVIGNPASFYYPTYFGSAGTGIVQRFNRVMIGGAALASADILTGSPELPTTPSWIDILFGGAITAAQLAVVSSLGQAPINTASSSQDFHTTWPTGGASGGSGNNAFGVNDDAISANPTAYGYNFVGVAGKYLAVTISIASPTVITWANHRLTAGSAVVFSTTGALPTGLTAGTAYYVSSAGLAAGSFQVADTYAHAIAGTNSINTSGTQSGTQTCSLVVGGVTMGFQSDINSAIPTVSLTPFGGVVAGSTFAGLFTSGAFVNLGYENPSAAIGINQGRFPGGPIFNKGMIIFNGSLDTTVGAAGNGVGFEVPRNTSWRVLNSGGTVDTEFWGNASGLNVNSPAVINSALTLGANGSYGQILGPGGAANARILVGYSGDKTIYLRADTQISFASYSGSVSYGDFAAGGCLFYVPLGYVMGSGVGGTVTQATSKSTGVTLSKASGQITMNGAALGANGFVSFVLTNTLIAAADILAINHASGGTFGAYALSVQCGSGSATIGVRNLSGGSLSEAIVLGFDLIKGATS